MKNPKLASRYAAAFYNFVVETDSIEIAYNDILLVQKVVTENKELKTVMESPIIPVEKKIKIFKKIFTKTTTETTIKFFTLVLKKRREPQMLMICREFIKIYYVKHNIKEVYITSSQLLSQKMKNYLQNFIEKDSPYTYFFYYSVDNKIIGGFVIKIDDLYFDASILTKINKLKSEFSQNAYAIGF